MSASNFNELGNAAMHRVALASKLGNTAGTSNTHPAANPTTPAGEAQGASQGATGRSNALLGAGIDWFSQLDSGTAHPMKASNQFGSNPPIDTIVDSIMSNLGLQPGSE